MGYFADKFRTPDLALEPRTMFDGALAVDIAEDLDLKIARDLSHLFKNLRLMFSGSSAPQSDAEPAGLAPDQPLFIVGDTQRLQMQATFGYMLEQTEQLLAASTLLEIKRALDS